MSRQYPRTHEQLLRIWSEEEIAERRQRTREKVLEAIEPWLFKIVFYYGFSKGAHFEKQEGYGIYLYDSFGDLQIEWHFSSRDYLNISIKDTEHPSFLRYKIGNTQLDFRELLDTDDLSDFDCFEKELCELVYDIEQLIKKHLTHIKFANSFGYCQSAHHDDNHRLDICEENPAKQRFCEECYSLEEAERVQREQAEKNMIDAAKALAIAERAKMAPSRRLRIMQRDNFHCVFCGRGREDGIKLHVDHIVPIAKGGKTEDDNLGYSE